MTPFSVPAGNISLLKDGLGVLLGSLVGGRVASAYGHRAAYYMVASSTAIAFALLQVGRRLLLRF
jgi:predicted MFS family arabinose efflux permease